ncbi:MAG: hypothetical protein MUF58_02655 [Arcicella sp.]|nr:hypothetical protein [Arcicella sp.]
MNKKIVGKIYFLLIWTMPVIYGGMIVLTSLNEKNITFSIDNDENESPEKSSTSPDIDDVEPTDNLLQLNFLKTYWFSSISENANRHFLLSAYNVCLEQKTPPP